MGLHLRFPCECVSNLADTDLWAEIAKKKLLPNGTKEQILTLLADEPKTISHWLRLLSYRRRACIRISITCLAVNFCVNQRNCEEMILPNVITNQTSLFSALRIVPSLSNSA